MAIGGAFLGGGVEVVPAGSCKLELEILTEDRANLTATFTIKGTSTYTVTAGADGRAVYTVPSGQTYTVSVNTTGYDNLASQTVVAESGTVRYVRFEAFAGRVKRSGDTMGGTLKIENTVPVLRLSNTKYAIADTLESNWTMGDISFFDKSGKEHSIVRSRWIANGRHNFQIQTTGQNGTAHSIQLTVASDGTGWVEVPTPSSSSDNSTKIATTAWVNGASSVVHTSNDEEIQGYKKFSKSPITTAWTGYHITLPGMTKGEKVASINTDLYTGFFDKNDTGTNQPANMMAGLRFTVPPGTESAPPNTFIELSNQYYRNTYLRLYDNGTTAYATCPNPPSNANTNQITTASWTLGKFVQKSGDTMTGTLTLQQGGWNNLTFKHTKYDALNPSGGDERTLNICAYDVNTNLTTSLTTSNNTDYVRTYLASYGYKSDGTRVSSAIDIYANRDGTAYVLAPSWSVGTNDNSNKILTIKMANKLPSLVHTSDDEDIQGIKTFRSRLVNKKSWDMGMEMISESFNRDNTYSAYVRPVQFICRDVDGDTTFVLQQYAESNDRRGLDLTMYDKSGNAVTLGIKSNVTFRYATAPTTPSIATSNEIATADWVIGKVAQRNKVTNVTSYTQLMDLIKSGKRGDSFGITMDYVGGSLGGITATNREVHAFGHYTIDEITVSGGALTGLQAFGSGEVSGMLKDNDNTTYTYATTGFGRQKIGNGVIDALRVVEDGKLTYFAPNDDGASISAFEGYYISI